MDKNILKELKIPKNIVYSKNVENKFFGVFEVKPLEKGFGVTLGNSMRRVMYSVLRGFAITTIKIDYEDDKGNRRMVASEFDNIPFLLEDTIDLVLNLKKIRLKLNSEDLSKNYQLHFEGPYEIKAKDFEASTEVEVINKDLYIATLEKGGKLDIEFTVENGRGFIPGEKREQEIEIIGTIPIDAIYSPIKNVKYEIEPTRVGNITDYEKLVLQVETDGTITPDEAVKNAAFVILKYFSIFVENLLDEKETFLEEADKTEVEEQDEELLNILDRSLETLEFTERVKNCFKGANIISFRDLLIKSESELNNLRNFGKKSLDEVKEKIESMGLRLGMKAEIDRLESKYKK